MNTTQPAQPICDLCGASINSCVYRLEGYDILRCKSCGLVFRYPMPTNQQLYEMYNTFPVTAEEQLIAYYRDFRRKTFRRMLLKLMQIHENTSQFPLTVLDSGAGRGWSYSVIRELGHHPIGLDLGFHDCLFARTEGPTLQASTEHLPLSSACVDVIIMSDVLEHVRDPRLILSEAHRVLTPGGYLILRVPDISGVLIRTFDYTYRLTAGHFKKPGKMLYRLHLYGFKATTLSRYLGETGFRVAQQYRESSKNPAELRRKDWAQKSLIRLGITSLVHLGEILNRQDELIVIAQR